jgi:hypothetical protein
MISRTLSARIVDTSRQYPVLFLTGPRQSGKTTLARHTFPSLRYISLEDLQNRQEATEDPRGFLRRLKGEGAILDEVQRAPDLFSYIQGFVDERRGGPLILTGSQHFLLSERISQTLAGRVVILELLPFSLAELAQRPALRPEAWPAPEESSPGPSGFSLDEILFTGLFPRIHDQKLDATTWLDGYVRTYVERDVRSVGGVGDLDTFARFVGLCAGRVGQLLNASSLGADAGVSHVTAKKWLSVLQASYVVDLLRPHSRSFSKRLVKSPKLYFVDTGLLCYLLGIRRIEDLHRHPLRGPIFENFVVTELRKLFLHHGQRPPLYFWRDSNGREVDVIIDYGNRVVPVEAKSGETVASDAFKGLDHYLQLSGESGGHLVHGGGESYARGKHWLRAWWSCS